MPVPDLSQFDSLTLRAMLQWQMELGATEAIGDAPVNRYAETAAPSPVAAPAALAVPAGEVDCVAEAQAAVRSVQTLAELAEVQAAFELCDIRKGARNFVFADGDPAARVMVIGEAPGRDEDIEGRPFVGRAGQLLDRMFAAIGLDRQQLYITNVMPWRPPGNRTPQPEEIAMMLPFLERHVALADPEVVVLMGNTPCGAALGRTGILKLRGQWVSAFGKPALPMTHPAYLLRNPAAKREAWADLLAIQARLRSGA
ncbi:MAG: uracil-DNA glycosylase [Defluviimonas sp.]|nr:uracil-DNA glycosylase [Defluviimonas sp.]